MVLSSSRASFLLNGLIIDIKRENLSKVLKLKVVALILKNLNGLDCPHTYPEALLM